MKEKKMLQLLLVILLLLLVVIVVWDVVLISRVQTKKNMDVVISQKEKVELEDNLFTKLKVIIGNRKLEYDEEHYEVVDNDTLIIKDVEVINPFTCSEKGITKLQITGTKKIESYAFKSNNLKRVELDECIAYINPNAFLDNRGTNFEIRQSIKECSAAILYGASVGFGSKDAMVLFGRELLTKELISEYKDKIQLGKIMCEQYEKEFQLRLRDELNFAKCEKKVNRNLLSQLINKNDKRIRFGKMEFFEYYDFGDKEVMEICVFGFKNIGKEKLNDLRMDDMKGKLLYPDWLQKNYGHEVDIPEFEFVLLEDMDVDDFGAGSVGIEYPVLLIPRFVDRELGLNESLTDLINDTESDKSASVVRICEGAFKGYSNLSNLIILANLESVGRGFLDGTAVTEITLPGTLTHIDSEAFAGSMVDTIVFDCDYDEVDKSMLAMAPWGCRVDAEHVVRIIFNDSELEYICEWDGN